MRAIHHRREADRPLQRGLKLVERGRPRPRLLVLSIKISLVFRKKPLLVERGRPRPRLLVPSIKNSLVFSAKSFFATSYSLSPALNTAHGFPFMSGVTLCIHSHSGCALKNGSATKS